MGGSGFDLGEEGLTKMDDEKGESIHRLTGRACADVCLEDEMLLDELGNLEDDDKADDDYW